MTKHRMTFRIIPNHNSQTIVWCIYLSVSTYRVNYFLLQSEALNLPMKVFCLHQQFLWRIIIHHLFLKNNQYGCAWERAGYHIHIFLQVRCNFTKIFHHDLKRWLGSNMNNTSATTDKGGFRFRLVGFVLAEFTSGYQLARAVRNEAVTFFSLELWWGLSAMLKPP